jgi:hexosaminidase
VQIEALPGEFRLTPGTMLYADQGNQSNAAYLHDLLSAPSGFALPVLPLSLAQEGISLRLNPKLAHLGQEGYHLLITPAAVILEAPTPGGVFYALQTLRQMFPASIERRALVAGEAWRLPAVEIYDWPRFSWRGFMLDEGRHFQGKEAVLQTLDLMALHKLNIFHWHLTEDQGWRIQIKAYPRLTEVGAWRDGTSRGVTGRHNGIRHGGFYTQDEIRQVVDYAAQRHITILPEIELPGHSLAALAAYPELSCTGGPFQVATHFGIFSDVYCAGKEGVFDFLQTVLDEVLDLFPSPFIHIGGDEVPKKRWKACPDCQRRIRQENLSGEHALQVYFTNRILAHMSSRGRRAVGWNQILEQGLAKDAVIQYWMGSRKALLQAIKADRRQVVMSSYLDAYLDHSYSLMPLSRAYRYEPVPAQLSDAEAACILGLEFPLWGEYVRSRARLDYQAYPRLSAMAETGWTPSAHKDLKSFRSRLEFMLKRLDVLGVAYAPLEEAEPSWLKQRLGIFTIPLPQTKTSTK